MLWQVPLLVSIRTGRSMSQSRWRSSFTKRVGTRLVKVLAAMCQNLGAHPKREFRLNPFDCLRKPLYFFGEPGIFPMRTRNFPHEHTHFASIGSRAIVRGRARNRHFGAERWLVKRVQDPGGVALTETIEYYDDPADRARYGKVRQIIKPDGSWLRHEYNDRGRTIATIRPWKDSPAGSQPQEAKAERYASRRLEIGEPFYDPRAKLNETWTTVLGVETSRTFSVTSYDNDGGKVSISERAHSPEAKFGDEKNLRTVSRYYPNTAGPASRNKLRETTSQTGEVTRYTYTYGDYLGLEAVPGDFQPAEDAPLRD